MSIDYWDTSLSEDEAGRIIETVCQTITSIILDPRQEISKLNLLSLKDAKKIESWHQNETLRTVPSTIHGCFQRRVMLQASKVAACSTMLDFTYEKLDDLASSLAHNLAQLGISRGNAVPICMEKSVWTIVAMLGVLRAGAAFVPLDPSNPSSRLGVLIDEAEATVIISSHDTHEKVRSIQRPGLIVLQVETAATMYSRTGQILPMVDPADTAYIIFTSGATGTPKGVVVSHQAACGSIKECAKAFGLSSNSRALQFSAYTWDAIICEIFSTLICGGTVLVPNETERTDGLAAYIEKSSVNWLFLTPTVLRLIPVERIGDRGLTIVTIGEPLGWDLVERWHNKALLINSYGPTETCVACTAQTVRSADETSVNAIGKPFGCRAWVVAPDNHDLLSPIGSVGELLVEGPNIAQGYYRDTQKTAEAFIRKPLWATEASFRFYKTGDLVRQNVDGSMTFFGRKDTQTKVNGQRVELGEIEHHLLSLESVDHVVVMVPKQGSIRGKLVAALSIKEYGDTMTKSPAQTCDKVPLVDPSLHGKLLCKIAHLQKYLEEKLPTYMVPTLWIPMTSLPMLSSGKTDRSLIHRWLNSPEAKAWVVDDDSMAQLQPATPTEARIQQIWADVLEIPALRVGTDRSFFHLGGDSISAMKVASISRSCGVSVTVENLLRRQTIVELASVADTDPSVSAKSRLLKKESGTLSNQAQKFPLLHLRSQVALDQVIKSCCLQLGVGVAEIEDIYPCSPMQEGILLAQARSSQVYDQTLTWRVLTSAENSPDVLCKLTSTWQYLVERHAILRTAFIEYPLQERHLVQVVLARNVADVTRVTVEDYKDLVDGKALQLSSQKVLHHLTIFETRSNEIYITLHFNHALFDATSLQLLIDELCGSYKNDLLSLAPSYASFIAHLEDQDPEQVQKFWQARLSDVEPCVLSEQREQGSNSRSRAGKSLTLHSGLVDRLRSLCSESGITIAALSNTLWALILSLFLNRGKVCFGYLATGRDVDVPDVQDIVGPLVTLLVCHTTVQPNLSVLELARSIQDAYAESLPYQHFSLAKVYHALNLQGGRLFDTMVNVQPSGTADKRSGNQPLSMIPVHGVTPSEVSSYGSELCSSN